MFENINNFQNLFFPAVFFLAFIGFLIISIFRNWKVTNPQNQAYSIIIACRNEEHNLPSLFKAFEQIQYPQEKYEIILVDDASEDNTLKQIEEFCDKNKNAIFFSLKDKHSVYKGKKAALKKAIENSRFDFLLFTDADCIPPSNWLNSFNDYLSQDVGMVVGYSPEKDVSLFRSFTQIMSASIYFYTIRLGIPFSSHGRNLVINKNAFYNVEGFEKIKQHTCGEDKQLLNLIKNTKYRIAYNPDIKVFTKPNTTNYIDQQKRRYGQFGLSSPFYKFLSIVVCFLYLYIPFGLFIWNQWIAFISYFTFFLFYWIITLLKHKERFNLIHIIYLLFYPYYLIFFSILGMMGNWKWKPYYDKSNIEK